MLESVIDNHLAKPLTSSKLTTILKIQCCLKIVSIQSKCYLCSFINHHSIRFAFMNPWISNIPFEVSKEKKIKK